ncbi:MAG: NUDIX domain-containing protein [Chloroflexi bacterium]|nr:NUDIX domain-containing protein [Chloroflexota bacterium]
MAQMAVMTRRAVALAILHRDSSPVPKVLGVRRPDDPTDDLAGLWGLPAATLVPDETEEMALQRLAREKLGLKLSSVRLRRRGRQRRPTYILAIALYEATIQGEPRLPPKTAQAPGVTYYDAWRWMVDNDLTEALNRGSLCARLYLDALASSPYRK